MERRLKDYLRKKFLFHAVSMKCTKDELRARSQCFEFLVSE